VDVFLSVGTGLSPAQEAFVTALEGRLRSEGLLPHTLSRNEWSTLAPLDAVTELMARCQGAVILGLERYYFAKGTERRGSTLQRETASVAFATSWNQIEAALAYKYGLPMLVIVQDGVKTDGLLEPGHDWYVSQLRLDPNILHSDQFNGLLRSWRGRLFAAKSTVSGDSPLTSSPELSKLSIRDLLGMLRPAEFWGLVVIIATLLAGALTIGIKISPFLDSHSTPKATSEARVPVLSGNSR